MLRFFSALRFAGTQPCLARKAATAVTISSRINTTTTTSTAPCDRHAMLADTHPFLVSGWMGAATSKFESPYTLDSKSSKLGWWRCEGCEVQYRRRVSEHVAVGGRCPHCKHAPTETPHSKGPAKRKGANGKNELVRHSIPNVQLSLTPTVVRPIRTGSTTMAAVYPAAIRKHITDVPFFANCGPMRKVLQPMLAHSFDDRGHKVKFSNKPRGAELTEEEKLFVSPKIDGVRCLIARDPTTGAIYYFSRQGLLFDSCDHLDKHFMQLFSADPTAIIDGELYYRGPTIRNKDGMTFEELMSTVRTGKANRTATIEETQKLVQYHAFDISYSEHLNADGLTKSGGKGFGERLSHLTSLISKCHENCDVDAQRLLQLVPHKLIYSLAEAFTVRDEFLAMGYEGAMLRKGGAPYGHGKRSANLLKMKCMQDAEFKIVGAVEGQGRMADSLGAFVCKTPAGCTFTVSPAVDEARRKELWVNARHMIGAALTVQFQEISTQGIPRFPVGKAIRGPSMSSATWL